MRNDRCPDCPRGLSPEARRLWRRLHAAYDLTDEHALATLEAGLRAFDVAHGAERSLAEHGAVTRDRFGQLRANPAAAILRDHRGQFLAALRALNLDPDRPGPGRPPARHPAVGTDAASTSDRWAGLLD